MRVKDAATPVTNGATMPESAPYIDVANLPMPTEGILATMFITVREVARSRDFYSRILGGAVVLEENPCMVKLSNTGIIMYPGGGPTPDKPGISVSGCRPAARTRVRRPRRRAGSGLGLRASVRCG